MSVQPTTKKTDNLAQQAQEIDLMALWVHC